MRRLKPSKQLPYLTEYIKYAVDWLPRHWHDELTARVIGLGLGISFLVGLVAMIFVRPSLHIAVGLLTAGVSFGVYLLGIYGITEARRAKEQDPQLVLRREAEQVAVRLEACLSKKRLHRDLSIEVSCLLEEASRNWHRAKTALESPYWKRADLPPHLRAVRDQSLLAIDQGMQEMLVLFATCVPAHPGSWSFGELVDEVVGQDVFSTRGRIEHISPFHEEGRAVAGKILELADQVEMVSRQLAGQELITGAPKPGSALEATLTELRQLKQAEEELRQDLRG